MMKKIMMLMIMGFFTAGFRVEAGCDKLNPLINTVEELSSKAHARADAIRTKGKSHPEVFHQGFYWLTAYNAILWEGDYYKPYGQKQLELGNCVKAEKDFRRSMRGYISANVNLTQVEKLLNKAESGN